MDQYAKKPIMVIGSDAQFTYLMQRYISSSAHQIISVHLGEDVIARAKCEKPAAIVLDVDPPQMIGWQILQALKADPDVRDIPVIVCSWLNEDVRGRELGADCYLHMPILYADFEAMLATTLLKE